MSISLPIASGSIGDITQLTVDARALHQALGVKRDFSAWIKARIEKYGFVQNQDYEKSSMISNSPNLVNGDFKGLRTPIEYRLSLDMGKELAMVENNERGRMVRRYFIECERRLNEPDRDRLSTVEDRRPLNTIVHTWAQASNQKYSMCWKQVNSAFSLEKAAEFPARWIPDAVAWVQAKIDALEARRAPELPAPESTPAFPMELAEYNGKNFWKDLEDIIKRITVINSALALNARTGCLMKHEFYADTINNQVGLAQGSLVLARAALGDALRLKGRRDVWK